MCDDFTAADNAAASADALPLSRRRFTVLGSAGALALLLPPYGASDEVIETDVEVPTADGTADCYFAHPAAGVHAGVIVWPDILGLRPAFRAMGRRLAVAWKPPLWRGQSRLLSTHAERPQTLLRRR